MFLSSLLDIYYNMKIRRKNSSSLIDKLIKWAGFVLLMTSTSLLTVEAEPICYGKVDIVFTVDASFSISDPNFAIVRTFLLDLHTKMKLDLETELRTGFIFYGKTPYTGDKRVTLTDDQTKIGELLKTFKRDTSNVLTNTGAALGEAYNMFDKDARNDAYKILVLLTDGEAKDRALAYENADKIKGLEVHILTIGIGFDGDRVSRTELNYIASSTDSVYIITEIDMDVMKMIKKDICGQTLASKAPPTVPKDDVKMDLYFFLDESMLENDFLIAKRFMKSILQTFLIGVGKAMVSVNMYGSSIGIQFNVNSYTTEVSLFNAIDNLALTSNNQNGRNVLGVFSTLDAKITNSGTKGPVIVVLFITGSVEKSANAIQKAKEYRDSSNLNIYLLILGIGTNTQVLTSQQNQLAYDIGTAFQAADFLTLSGNNQQSIEFVNLIRNTIFQLAKGTYVRQGTGMSYRWTSLFDVVFMIDGSAKMSQFTYYPVLKFVIKHLINQFQLGPDAGRVAILVFDAAGVYNIIRFDTYDHNHDILFKKIDNLQLIQREDSVDNAVGLAGMFQYFMENQREPAGSKLGYLVTLGQARDELLAEAEARALAREGIQLLTIGISPGASQSELNSYQLFEPVDGPTIVSRIESIASITNLKEMASDLLRYAQISRPRGLIYRWNDMFDLIVLVHNDSARLDGGASVRNFLMDLFSRYEIARDKVQAGVISFGSIPQDKIILGDDSFYTALYVKLLTLNLSPAGGSNVALGLQAVRTMFDKHGRSNVPKVALLLMQGDVVLDHVKDELQRLRDKDIAIATIGIGAETDIVDLQNIANHEQLAFLQTSWQSLRLTPRIDASLIALARGSFRAQQSGDILRLPTQCTGEDVGIIFALDASSSFKDIFPAVKKFVAALMSGFSADVKIGAFAYANTVIGNTDDNKIITLGEYTSFVELYAHFMANVNPDPNFLTTATHLAIKEMIAMFEKPGNTYKEKIGIVITDGKSSIPTETNVEAQNARNKGIKMIAISFLADTFQSELDQITGQEITGGVNHKFVYSNSDLINPSKLEAVQKLICALIRPGECLAGSYRDPFSLECMKCPVGSFQVLSEQLFCEKCAIGYSTTDPGKKRTTDCIKKCNAGYYLESVPNGKCMICQKNTYQPQSGQTGCISCTPSTLITKFEGSTSKDDCILDKCDKPMDLIFVVDTTASIGVFELQMLKAFLINQLDRFNFGITRISLVRIGVITKEEDVTEFFTDKDKVVTAIRSMKSGDYSTNIASAIKMGNNKFENDGRNNIPQVLFMITDGIASNPYAARYEAFVAQQRRELVVLGIGTQYFLHELEEYASDPDTVLKEQNFEKLASLDAYLTICKAAKRWTPPPDIGASKCNLALNLIIIMDMSESLKPGDTSIMKFKLVNFVKGLQISGDKVNIGVLSFGEKVGKGLQLPLSSVVDDIERSIMMQVSAGYGTVTDLALLEAKTMLENSKRSNAANATLIITDGASSNPVKTADAANILEKAGIYVVAVGVGSGDVLERELDQISTSGSDTTILVDSLRNLQVEDLNTKVCPENFKCSYVLQVVYIWDLTDDSEVLANTKKLAADVSQRFKDVQAKIMEVKSDPTQDINTLVEGMTKARQENQALKVYNTIHNVVLVTNKPSANIGSNAESLKEVTNALKEEGAKITIVNARNEVDNGWEQYATSKETVFHGSNFNETVPAWKFHRSLCKEPCDSGYEVSKEGKCVKCAKGSYRDKTESYMCRTCSADSTTKSTGSTSRADCTIEIQCAKAMDLAFVIDATASIGRNYNLLQAFFWSLVDKFPVGLGDNETRIAVVKIGEDVDNIGDFSLFSQSESSSKVKASIIGLRGGEQSTNTAASLEKVFDIFITEGRDSTKYPLIVLAATDGKSLNTFQTKRFSSILKLNGIRTLVISLGDAVFQPEIDALAYDDKSVFNFKTYKDLVESTYIPEKICDAAENYRPVTPVTPGNDLLGECKSYMDMVFVIDASASVTYPVFLQMKIFIIQFAQKLDIGQDRIRIGVIAFSSTVHDEVFSLSQCTDMKTLQTDGVIPQVWKSGGITNTAAALDRMIKMFDDEGRENIPFVSIVMTDGKSNSPTNTKKQAQIAKDKGIHIVAYGFGPISLGTNVQELYDMATDRDSVKAVERFAELSPEQLLDLSCSFNFECSNKMNLIVVWDLVSFDNIRRAEIFIDSLKKRFLNSVVTNIFVDHVANAAIAMKEAVQKQKSTSHTNFRVARVIVLITDNLLDTGVKAQLNVELVAAKADGILVAVIDAATTSNNIGDFASNDKLSFFTNRYDMLPFELVIKRSLCTAPCSAGYQVTSTTGTCKKCGENTYRDIDESFLCQTCPTGRTTDGATASDKLSDCLLGNCLTPMDIIFVVDSSASIQANEYTLMKVFLLNLIGRFDISKERTMVAILPYSSDVLSAQVFQLQQSTDPVLAMEAVRNLTQGTLKTGTNTARALDVSKDMLKVQGRSTGGVIQVIVLLTDGMSTNTYKTIEEANKAKEEFIRIFVVGVGSNVFNYELDRVASDEDSKWMVPNFLTLATNTDFITRLCEDTFTCSKSMDIVIFEDRTTGDAAFKAKFDNFSVKLAASYSQSSTTLLSYTNMAELSTYVNNQDLSIKPQRTKIFIFIVNSDISDLDVRNKIVSKLRRTGGIVSVINAKSDLDNINFVTIVTSLQFLFKVENFNDMPAYRYIERKFCIDPCNDGQQRDMDGLCEKCARGTYRDKTVSHNCVNCTDDKTTKDTGTTVASDCIPNCGPGFKTVGDKCVECDKGTYQAERFQSDCNSCIAGYSTAETKSTSVDQCIKDCEEGKRISPTDQEICVDCDVNTYQPARAQSQCLACPINLSSLKASDSIDDCNDECNKNMDIIFVVDASISLSAISFKLVKVFLENSVYRFKVGLSFTRIGIIQFGNNVPTKNPLDLTGSENRTAVSSVIRGLVQSTTPGTNTAAALDAAVDMSKNQGRSGIPQNIIIVTDGKSDNMTLTVAAAARAKRRFINIISIGVGTGFFLNELKQIATDDTALKTFTSFYSLINFNVLPTVCPPPKLCDKNMDIFYIKYYDGNTDVDSKVNKFITDLKNRYLTSTTVTKLDADENSESLQDDLNEFSDTTKPTYTKVVIIFTNKVNTEGALIADDVKANGVIVVVVNATDVTSEISYKNSVASNENLVFFAKKFDESPYIDYILRSLCIAPCGVGSQRAKSGDCELCPKGKYKDVTSHTCEDCPSQQTTSGLGATNQNECVVCQADEIPCKTGVSTIGNPCIPVSEKCNGINNCNDGSDEICNTCTKGFKWTGSACVQCEKGTYQDTDKQTECKKCPDGSTTDGIGKTALSECNVLCDNSGQELIYPDGGCKDCKLGYFRDKDQDAVCVKCDDDFITIQTGATSKDLCVSPCEAGQGLDTVTKTCVDCVRGTYQPDANEINCLSCPAGTITNNVKSTKKSDCKGPCDPGKELPTGGKDRDDCKECPLNTYISSTNVTCQPCPPEHITLQTGSSSSDSCIPNCDVGNYYDESLKTCKKCDFGTYQDNKYQKSCKSCSTGKTTRIQGSDKETDCIVPCPAGSYLPFRINGQCTPCPQGTFRVNDETIATCTSCESGKNTDREGSTSIADCKPDCQPGETIVGSSCQPCEIGTYQKLPRQISCDPCGDYTSTEQTGADSPDKCVDTCPSGTELINKNPLQCKKCAMNQYKEVGVDKKCTDCPANHITLADGATSKRECIPDCKDGQRYDSSSSQCEDCDIGTFQFEFYKDFCYICRDGWTTVIKGAKKVEDCLPDCKVGEYWDEDTVSCKKCPKDSYQSEQYQSSCDKCPFGKFADNIGAIFETQCKDQCPLGKEMGPGGTTTAECVPCEIGNYKDKTKTTCQSCPDGFTTLDKGKTSSSDCITPCTEGQRYDVNLKICVDCEVGRYQDNRNKTTCEKCFEGLTTLQTGSKLETDCIPPCKPGSGWDYGMKACKPCWKGKYQDQANQVECKVCPDSKTTEREGSDDISDCIDITIACKSDEWQCIDKSKCIANNLRCDQSPDCNDGTDESTCCVEGQYYSYTSNQCEACPAGTYQDLPEEFTCIICPKGKTSKLGSVAQSNCTECDAGSELKDGETVCTECPINTYSEQGMMECSNCPPNFISNAGTTSLKGCIPNCQLGQYYDIGNLKCEPCPVGYYQDKANQAQCIRCTTGTTTDNKGSTESNQCKDICDGGQTLVYDSDGKPTTSCNPCPVSEYKDGSTCKSCENGFTTASTGSTECLPDCDAGYFYHSKTNAECRPCPRGQFQPYRLQLSCVPCPDGQTTPKEVIGATTQFLCYDKCSAGYKYDSSKGSCEICPKGTYRPNEDGDECKSCKTGFTTDGPGSTSEDQCVPNCVFGQFYNRQASRCEPCPIDTYQKDPNKYFCEKCPAGTTVSSTGSDDISDCKDPCTVPGEELQPDGSCGQCKQDTAKIPPSTICTQCPDGFTTEGLGKSECVPNCLEGHYWDGTKCVPCAKGQYQQNKHQEKCLDCPTGRTTAVVGASKPAQCIDICPNGFELSVNGVCKPCDKNYFRTKDDQLQCTPCPKDFITFFEGAEKVEDCHVRCLEGTEWNPLTSKCEPCKVGHYQDEKYQKQCKSCDSGKTTINTGQTSKDACIGKCDPGTYWSETDKKCTDCAKGTYQTQPNKTSCVSCKPGYTTDFPKSTSEDDCIDKCTSGYTYDPVTDSCKKCGKNKYRDADNHNICVDCPPGLYTVTETAISEAACISYCVAGYYWSKDKKVCIQCEIGYYQPASAARECLLCNDGWVTENTGSTKQTDCRPPCVEGEEWDPTSKTCVPCPRGKYQDMKNQESCKSCATGLSTESIRSTKQSDCKATTCTSGQWKCLGVNECIDLNKRCDGSTPPDCSDDSDEQGCDCQPGTYYDETTKQCKDCKKGTYQDASGQLSCIECPAGSDSEKKSDSRSDCKAITCSSGQWKCLDVNECIDLNKRCDGSTPPDCSDGSDEQGCNCQPGTYYDESSKQCKDCKKGTYQDASGQLSCIECPAGTDSEKNSDSRSDCKAKCPKGYYYKLLPNPGCEICPLGYIQEKDYTPYSCDKCEPGTTTTVDDRKTCTDVCGLGEYLPLDGTSATDCKKCEPGYYKDGSVYVCRICPNGFMSLSGSDSVDDCYETCEAGEEFIDQTLNTGCKPCDRGYYRETPPTKSDKSCKSCPAGKSTKLTGATSQTVCQDLCNDGLELSADKDSCVECKLGEYRSQGSSDTECVSCPTGTNTSTAGSATVDACKRNCGLGHRYDSANNECVKCEIGSFQENLLQTTCTECPAWKSTLEAGSTSYNDCIDLCIDGYESEDDVCVECERGTFRQQNVQPGCEKCRDKFTTLAPRQDTSAKCVPICDRGYRWDEDSNSCKKCEDGTYNPVEYQLECLPCPVDKPISSPDRISCQAVCPPGEQWNAERQICNWCPPGTYSNQGYNECTLCPLGTYSDIMGASFCTAGNCGPGQVIISNTNRVCVQCTGNRVANPTRQICENCPLGQTPSEDHSTCETNWCPGGKKQTPACDTPCDKGTFRPTRSKKDCQPCPLNQYQDNEGQEQCKPCQSGQTTQEMGRKDVNDCKSAETNWCRGGKKQTPTCDTPCDKGTFRPNKIKKDCMPCPLDQYQDNEGQEQCKPCPSGQTTQETGRKDVNDCKSETNWCRGGKKQTSTCDTPCDKGTFRPTRSKKDCQPCPLNQYQDNEGQEQCKPCPSGQTTQEMGRKDVNDCKSATCPKGSFINSETKSCEKCGMNTFSDKENSVRCTPCGGRGRTKGIGSTSADMCNENWCPGGYTFNDTIQSCEPCGFGKYRRFKLDPECITCTDGRSTLTNTASSPDDCVENGVRSCVSGYIYKDGRCKPCPIGTYSSSNRSGCTPCPSGFTTRSYGSYHENLCITMNSACERQFDLVIAVDLSNSVTHDASHHVHKHLKYWLKCLIRRLDIHPFRVRVSIVKYARGVSTLINLHDSYTAENVCRVIDSGFKPSVRLTVNTAGALRKAYDLFRQQGRPGVQKHVLLIMDDRSSDPARAAEVAKYLKDKQVHITVIGTNLLEASHLASSHFSRFIIPSYLRLPRDYNVLRAVCRPRK